MPRSLQNFYVPVANAQVAVPTTPDPPPEQPDLEVLAVGPGMGGFPISIWTNGTGQSLWANCECGSAFMTDDVGEAAATRSWVPADYGAFRATVSNPDVGDAQRGWYDATSTAHFRGRRGGIEKSDDGLSWTTVWTGGKTTEQMDCFARVGSRLWAGMGDWRRHAANAASGQATVDGELVYSDDDGENWTAENVKPWSTKAHIFDLLSVDNHLYVFGLNHLGVQACWRRKTAGGYVNITGAIRGTSNVAMGRRAAQCSHSATRVYLSTAGSLDSCGDEQAFGQYSSVWATNDITAGGVETAVPTWVDIGPTTANIANGSRNLKGLGCADQGGGECILYVANQGSGNTNAGPWRLASAHAAITAGVRQTWTRLIFNSAEANVTRGWYTAGFTQAHDIVVFDKDKVAFTSPLNGGGQIYYTANASATVTSTNPAIIQTATYENPAGTFKNSGAMFVGTRGIWSKPLDPDWIVLHLGDWYRFITEDGGLTFRKATNQAQTNFDPVMTVPVGNDRYFLLAGHVSDQNSGVWESTDAGDTMTQRGTSQLPADRLYGGACWTPTNGAYAEKLFFTVKSNEANNATTLGGLWYWDGTTAVQCNGDSGGFDWSNPVQWPMVGCAYDETNNVMYVALERTTLKIYKATNWRTTFASPTWTEVTTTGFSGSVQNGPAFKVEASTGDLYAGTTTGYFRLNQGGSAWVQLTNEGNGGDEVEAKAIAFGPGTSNRDTQKVYLAGTNVGVIEYVGGAINSFESNIQSELGGVRYEGQDVYYNLGDDSLICGFDCSGNFLIRDWVF